MKDPLELMLAIDVLDGMLALQQMMRRQAHEDASRADANLMELEYYRSIFAAQLRRHDRIEDERQQAMRWVIPIERTPDHSKETV